MSLCLSKDKLASLLQQKSMPWSSTEEQLLEHCLPEGTPQVPPQPNAVSGSDLIGTADLYKLTN